MLRLVRPGVLLHFCEGCQRGHTIDVHATNRDGRVLGWDGSFDRPSIGEPVRHEQDGAVCEYILRAGVLYYLESSSHSLAGQARHLVEYPRLRLTPRLPDMQGSPSQPSPEKHRAGLLRA